MWLVKYGIGIDRLCAMLRPVRTHVVQAPRSLTTRSDIEHPPPRDSRHSALAVGRTAHDPDHATARSKTNGSPVTCSTRRFLNEQCAALSCVHERGVGDPLDDRLLDRLKEPLIVDDLTEYRRVTTAIVGASYNRDMKRRTLVYHQVPTAALQMAQVAQVPGCAEYRALSAPRGVKEKRE